MFYDAIENQHGLRHDPFKALVVPRPIGWVSTVSAAGVLNLAPYSFFNAIADQPHFVMFSSEGEKDTLRNISETSEFVCSLANYELRQAMNLSSATVAADVDEFELAGLTPAPSRLVRPPRVEGAPAAFECKQRSRPNYTMVIGMVVGIHIDDRYVSDGLVDAGAMRPIARLGYMNYSVLGPEQIFGMDRPRLDEAGEIIPPEEAPAWDGIYR
jgi:flavin reductase (DIM6/NTAB) family NADH-FMN oxidoreductase RutF